MSRNAQASQVILLQQAPQTTIFFLLSAFLLKLFHFSFPSLVLFTVVLVSGIFAFSQLREMIEGRG